MRVDKFSATKSVPSPENPGILVSTFYATSGYDLYQVGATVCVVKDGCVAIHLPQGITYLTGAPGKEYAHKLAKQFPKLHAP